MAVARRAILPVLLALDLLAVATPARAQDACTPLSQTLAAARQNFDAWSATPNVPRFDQAKACDLALTASGQRVYSCRWAWSYRSDKAAETFAALDRRIQRCLAVPAGSPEAGVNHPDSYRQHIYQSGDIRLSLSLKDKAALAQSLVFLLVRGRGL